MIVLYILYRRDVACTDVALQRLYGFRRYSIQTTPK
jgi:hypothetical protein